MNSSSSSSSVKLKKVITIANIQTQKVTTIPFEGKFKDAFGNPQNKGVWFIWGDSGSGKSSFVMQLAKAFAEHYPVLYNLLEEDPSDKEYIDRTKLFSMQDHKKTFHTSSYSPKELSVYLSRNKSKTKVVVIDSLPYFTKDWQDYMGLKKTFPNHIFVYVAHAKGKKPKTDFEDKVMFDARMKIFVESYLASCKGRTIGSNGGNFIIYKEGYEKIHGTNSSEEI